MNPLFTLILLILFATKSYGQNYFNINSKTGVKEIHVNGNQYKIDSAYSKIETLYPTFDTLSFINGEWDKSVKIICNFKPDSSYTFTLGCCATTDIIPSRKLSYDSLNHWDFEEDHSKIQEFLLDRPSFTLKTKNGSSKDSIYGWYVDHACFPSFKLLNEKGWEYGTPEKCFYWHNVSPFVFFISREDFSENTNEEGVVEDVYPDDNYELLGIIYVRLFDSQSFNMTYDVKTRKIILEYPPE